MKRLIAFGLPLVVIPLIISCSLTPRISKSERERIDAAAVPYAKVTSFSGALSNLGRMIETYGFFTDDYVVMGKPVVNVTACRNLPVDITDMVKTAVNKIGGNIHYAVYDPNFIIAELNTFGSKTIGRILPAVVIDGSISECDENYDTECTDIHADVMLGGGKTETDLSAGLDKCLVYTRLALDLHLMDYRTSLLMRKKQTSMAVDVVSFSKNRRFGIMIYGSGVGLDGKKKIVQGRHAAVRTLVDLSVLQLVGKYLEIPYWRCLPDGVPDKDVVEMMRASFDAEKPANRISMIQLLLGKCGYPVPVSGRLDSWTRDAVAAFNRMHGKTGGNPDGGLYVDLMCAVPMPFETGDRPAAHQRPVSSAEAQQPAVPARFSFSKLEFLARAGGRGTLRALKNGDTLRTGDDYKIVFSADHTCYLYIFQLDSSGKIYQLFPMESFNGVRVDNFNPVTGGATYILPGPNKAFVLDEVRGMERFYLLPLARRNPELEVLVREAGGDLPGAHSRLRSYLSQKRGPARIATDHAAAVKWDQHTSPFTIMTHRIDNICNGCATIVDFQHR